MCISQAVHSQGGQVVASCWLEAQLGLLTRASLPSPVASPGGSVEFFLAQWLGSESILGGEVPRGQVPLCKPRSSFCSYPTYFYLIG